jgi:hypothetical protein
MKSSPPEKCVFTTLNGSKIGIEAISSDGSSIVQPGSKEVFSRTLEITVNNLADAQK